MITTLIIFALLPIIQLVAFIIFIIILVKQFQHGGALHGIIGLITCGFWTFIWGWIKHKSLELTKTMILWTILVLSPFVLVGVFGFAIVTELAAIATTISQEGGIEKVMQDFDKGFLQERSGKKAKKTKKMAKDSRKSRTIKTSAKDVDWSKKAVALWKNGKYSNPQKALDYWNKAIRNGQKSSEAYNNRGLAFYNLKRYQPAIKDFSQAIRMNPQDATAYNNRGNTYYEMLKYEQAQSDYDRCIKLDPEYANAYLNRGLAYYQMDNNKLACADLAKACDLESENCDGIEWAKEKGICR